MATFLLAWELGAGLGHLVNLRPLAEGLSARGHRVVLALRDLSRAKSVFRGASISLMQAPFKNRRTKHIAPTLSFAHLLHNIGFSDVVELAGMAEAWREIYRHVAPDVIVFDHSPTALLAARRLPVKRALLGTGFFCPLDESPLACLRPWQKPDRARLAADEQSVLETANAVLRSWGERPLDRVAELYHPADEHFLVTFRELDHYPTRTGVRYWGAWPSGLGKPARWPSGQGKKVFAYLKPFAALPQVLDQLRRSGCRAIVYCDGVPDELQRHFRSPRLRLENEPLNMTQVAHGCDLAVLNANHGTAVAILLAGKPSLQIPLFLEQTLLAKAIARMGAAAVASPSDPRQINERFQMLSTDGRYAVQARLFADQYAAFDPNRQIASILDRLEELAASKHPSTIPGVEQVPWKDQVGQWMRSAADAERRQRSADARSLYSRVLAADPLNFDARYRMGLALQRERKPVEAAEHLAAALRLRPDDADVLNDFGCALWSLERFEDAANCFTKVLERRPDFHGVYNNLGCVLRALGRHQEAIESYQRALAIDPAAADVHNNLGCALRAAGRLEMASESYRRAIELKPEHADALANLGTLKLEQDHIEEAIDCHRRAICVQPDNFKLHFNLGAAHLRAGRFTEAIASHNETLRLQPGIAEVEFNRGVARLSLGQFVEGLADFEARLRSDKYQHAEFDQPLWNGSRLEGQTVLLHAEQGLGDTIQFIRYVPLVRHRGARVIVEVQPALVPLFQQSRIEGVFARGAAHGDFAFQAPLMSLPRIFQTTIESIPRAVPYLSARAELVEHWNARLSQIPGYKIGIHWQGSRTYEGDRWRSIPLKEFAALARVEGVSLISLQKNEGTEQIAGQQELRVMSLGEGVDETSGPFMDTAAIIESLDLVITCDSAVAHLAGALGANVWVCLPHVADWRWMCDRGDSPWYPTMRLFRQRRRGDWAELFERVANELQGNRVAQETRKTARTSKTCINAREGAQAHYRSGLESLRSNRPVEAVTCFKRAIECWPQFPEAHNDLGCALSALDQHAPALVHFKRATELKSDFADAHNNLGCTLRAVRRYDAAVESFRTALSIRPGFADAINNMGNVLQDQGKLDEAISVHRQALSLKPGSAEIHNSLAASLQRKGVFDDALKNFDEAIRLKPDHTEARYSRALIWLARGEFQRGWPEYEARQQSKRYNARGFLQPQWDGFPLADRTLLIHAEQGLGDTIQFVRYIPLVQERAKSVVVEVRPPLIPLLNQAGFKGLIARGSELLPFDLHAPLLSLPGLFNTTLESIPSAPYLSADPNLVEAWRQKLPRLCGLKVGINWQGSGTFKEDHVRSIPLRYFEPLARVRDVTLVSLQKNQGSEQLKEVADRFAVVELGPERDTQSGAFMDTAAIMKSLDLVIASDTAVAHLAGALGVPVWVCLPFVADWRWLIDREDCPWYPQMRLLRQPHLGDWQSVFETAARLLRSMASRSLNAVG